MGMLIFVHAMPCQYFKTFDNLGEEEQPAIQQPRIM